VDRVRGISTQTFVEGRPGTRQFTPECWRLLHSLLLPGETTSLSVHAGQWAQEVERGSENSVAVEAIHRLRDDTPLPACWEHGDFASWNVRRVSDERCALLDWEDANRNGLPLMDAYHFLHMQDFLFGGRPHMHADELRKGALGMGIAPKQARALERAYLVRTYLACVKRNCETRATFVNVALTMCRRRTD
jgi:aminoglycoside phosphotransferase (APT) family kinase protein